jgi:hypothetical protein
MTCEASPRVAQGIQTSGVGTDLDGEVARAGAGDLGGDAAQLKSDRLRRLISAQFSSLFRHPLLPVSCQVDATPKHKLTRNRSG